jgi:hypothetical protein
MYNGTLWHIGVTILEMKQCISVREKISLMQNVYFVSNIAHSERNKVSCYKFT